MLESTKQEILRLYLEEYLTAPQVAKRLELGSTTVYRVLHANGVEPSSLNRRGERKGNRKFNDQVESEIVSDYESGASSTELSEKYDVNLVTILNIVRRNGGQIRRVGNVVRTPPKKLVKEIIRKRKRGLSQSKIAEELDVSQGSVSRILRDNGYEGTRTKEDHPNWKGGRTHLNGYRYVLITPNNKFFCMANTQGYVAEHRLVMAKHLGRPLDPHETVHHKDGNRKNNRLRNLQLMNGGHPKGAACRCRNCGSTDIEFTDL